MPSRLLGALLCLVLGACSLKPQGRTDLHADLGLISVTGHPIELDGFFGEPVLLHFWATWCGPCVQELRSLQNVHNLLSPSGLQVVAIAIDSEPVEVSVMQKQLALSFPMLIDTQGLAKDAYNVRGVPETFLIGREGRIVRIKDPVSGHALPSIVGPRDWDDALSVGYLRDAVKG